MLVVYDKAWTSAILGNSILGEEAHIQCQYYLSLALVPFETRKPNNRLLVQIPNAQKTYNPTQVRHICLYVSCNSYN